MTRQEFLKYASRQPIYDRFHGSYSKEQIDRMFDENYNSGANPEKIKHFFANLGYAAFRRFEKNSGDELTVDVRYLRENYFWQDINCAVNWAGYIDNCAGIIEVFFLSEHGKFYNQDHKLIAENEEVFFDYITTVEYDFHPEIPQRTYHILRHFGWYEGRHIDTSEFEQKAQRRGIEFTREQLDFLSEFSDLHFSLSGVDWFFSSLSKILEDYVPVPEYPKHKSRVVVEHAFKCGGDDGGDIFYLTDDGLIVTCEGSHLGRTTMECINHLCSYSHKNESWLNELLKQDEAV